MRTLFLSTLTLTAMTLAPAQAQVQTAADKPALEIGAGGRPVGEAWSRSPV